MSYLEAKAERDRLEMIVASAEQVLKQFPKLPSGLTPDHVRTTAEYRLANCNFDKAFANLRSFNGSFVKKFKKEIAEDRRKRYR